MEEKSLDFSEFLCDKDTEKCVGGIPLYSNQESNFVTKDNWEISLKKSKRVVQRVKVRSSTTQLTMSLWGY